MDEFCVGKYWLHGVVISFIRLHEDEFRKDGLAGLSKKNMKRVRQGGRHE
jgi:hypothetical protein